MKVYRVVVYREGVPPDVKFFGTRAEARQVSIDYKGQCITECDTFDITYKYQYIRVLNDAVELGRAVGASVGFYPSDSVVRDAASGDMDRSE
jgi:hypothetical protein